MEVGHANMREELQHKFISCVPTLSQDFFVLIKPFVCVCISDIYIYIYFSPNSISIEQRPENRQPTRECQFANSDDGRWSGPWRIPGARRLHFS